MRKKLPASWHRIRSDNGVSKAGSGSETASGPIANFVVYWKTSPVGKQRAMSDVVVPGFKELAAQGKLVFNPMNSSRLEGTSEGSNIAQVRTNSLHTTPGQLYTVRGDIISTVTLDGYGSIPDKVLPSSLMPANLLGSDYSRAVNEACTQAQRLPSDANLLVSLAELHKTLRLVPDLLGNFHRFFQRFHGRVDYLYGRHLAANPKRQSVQNLRELERIVTDTWLAMRFGVRPLVMDMQGVLKALSRDIDESGPTRVTTRGKALVSAYDTTQYEGVYGIMRPMIHKTTHHEISVRAMSLWDIDDSLQHRVGFSIGQIPEAVIDLVSYSFVVNWLINVNDFFAAIGGMIQPGFKNLGGVYTVRDTRTVTRQIGDVRLTNPQFDLTIAPTGISTYTSEYKIRYVGLNGPKLTIRANPFKFLTDLRLVDAVALLGNGLRRSRYAGLH